MPRLSFRLYCRHCRKIVEVYDCHRKEDVIPEKNPEFNTITICCATCKKSIMKMTELNTGNKKEKR
jgi:uncharacterized CHY-type Zn-finger protein